MLLRIRILNGLVIDGQGTPGRVQDVVIDGDRVVDTGSFGPSEDDLCIDAKGLLVTPGFVDIHSHSDQRINEFIGLQSKLRQGVTTEVLGNCGGSAAPIKREWDDESTHDRPWTTVSSFLDYVESQIPGTNVAMLAGHGNLRRMQLGDAATPASMADTDAMRAQLKICLDEGCAGMSSGLIYAPGSFADEHELSAIAKGLPRDRIYTTHMRNESSLLFQSIKEAIDTARAAGCRLEISHYKACGKYVWGRANEMIAAIETAGDSGLDVAFDTYPYRATHTGLRQVMPPWTHDGGREALLARMRDPAIVAAVARNIESKDQSWENILVSAGAENIMISQSLSGEFDGRMLSDIATSMGMDPVSASARILLSERDQVGIISFEMLEEDVSALLAHPLCSPCSDGSGYSTGMAGQPHPRNFGTFPRFLGDYVMKRRIVSLEEGVRKMTSLPASRMNLKQRGVIARGAFADVNVIDAARLLDVADFATPKQYSTGFRAVLVNGIPAVLDDQLTGQRAGHVLRF
jgi:N-acyl-D-amino-acid deacylase